jgi:hypothetical protein
MTGRRGWRSGPWWAATVATLLALAVGCSKDHAPAAGPAPTSSASTSSAPVDPLRTPGELLQEAVAAAPEPTSMRVRATITMRSAVLLQLYGEYDPTEGPLSMFLDVVRRAGQVPIRSRTLVAEGELFLRRPGLPTRPGRPWLHLPGGDYPPGVLDEWATLSDLTDPLQHLQQLAEHGTGLSRTAVHYDSTRHTLVRGYLAGPDLPEGICAGSEPGRLHVTEVRLSVWINTLFEVSKLELACRYPDLPTVTWTGRYREVRNLALEFDPPRPGRVTELGGAGATQAA